MDAQPKVLPKRPIRPPRLMLILIPVLIVIAVITAPIIDGLPKDFKTSYVLITGIPFISVFVAILLAFISLIFVAAGRLNGKISERSFVVVEYTIMAGIILGIVRIFQP